MRKSLRETIMERDGMTGQEADELIAEARIEFDKLISEGKFAQAQDITYSYFGLEPDYLDDL